MANNKYGTKVSCIPIYFIIFLLFAFYWWFLLSVCWFIFMFHFSQFCFAVLFWLSCWIACSPTKDVCPCYHSDSHIVSFPKSWKDSFLTLWRLSEITHSSLNGCALNAKSWSTAPLDTFTPMPYCPIPTSYCTSSSM